MLVGMSKPNTAPRLSSLAMPTAADIELWQAMTRDEQLATLQEALRHPDASTRTSATVSGILAEVIAERRARGRK